MPKSAKKFESRGNFQDTLTRRTGYSNNSLLLTRCFAKWLTSTRVQMKQDEPSMEQNQAIGGRFLPSIPNSWQYSAFWTAQPLARRSVCSGGLKPAPSKQSRDINNRRIISHADVYGSNWVRLWRLCRLLCVRRNWPVAGVLGNRELRRIIFPNGLRPEFSGVARILLLERG